MKHGDSPVSQAPPSPQVSVWNVYNASHTLVATYSTEGAAASHVASWPALYYSAAPVVPPAPLSTLSVPS